MARIIWNKRAGRQLKELQEYLQEEFGEKTAQAFTAKTFKILELLFRYPRIGTLEDKHKSIRGFVLNRHSTIFYQERQGNIYILALFDNRQNPERKKV